MKIEKSTVVSVTYDLLAGNPGDNKEHIETADEQNPLIYLHGHHGLIEKFENELEGLSVGDTFNFEVDAAEAYGVIDAEAIVELPKETFAVDGKIDENILFVGNIIPMMDGEGHRMNGTITEIKEHTAMMDFNHPLAGKDLHFIGKVVEVRAATPEEIDHGHAHHPGMEHH